MNDAPDRTDEELARAAKRGDAAAYDALARRYLRPAMALAWQYTRRVEDAEDVVQDAFHRAVRALADYDDRRPFSAWFYTIVRNVARTAISKDGRRAALAPLTRLSLVEDEPTAPALVDPIVAADVERAIEALAPMQQPSTPPVDSRSPRALSPVPSSSGCASREARARSTWRTRWASSTRC